MSLLQLPVKIAHLLPNLSLMTGTSGKEQIAPRLYIDPMMPCKAPVGFPKNSFHASTICTAFIICESNPDVISMPTAKTTISRDPLGEIRRTYCTSETT